MNLKLILATLAVSLIASGCAPSTKPATIYSQWPFDATEAARRQDETAKALGIPKEINLDLGNGVKMKLVLIPAGKFVMGSPKDVYGLAPWECPEHEVTISKPFYMGSCHVTRGQFATFVKDKGYKTDAEKVGWSYAWDGNGWGEIKGASWKKPSFDQTDEHPVVCVSYNDAVAFCEWLSKKTGRTVKLPTEAQWEYACRGGTATAYQWGDNPDDGKGWCNAADQTAKKNSVLYGENLFAGVWDYFNWKDGYTFTSPVGKFKKNGYGLYDTCGNALEWCADWYDGKYYDHSPKTDPQGSNDKEYGTGEEGKGGGYCVLRVLRGGDWYSTPDRCRSAVRVRDEPVSSSDYSGFRVVILLGSN